jgi:hypothetical protein
MSETTLRRQIKRAVNRLPRDRLASLADFVAFLSPPTLPEQIERAERELKAGKGFN